jgi:PAS domain S-box-containing protein
MKAKDNQKATILRQKAEEQLKNKSKPTDATSTDVEIFKLVHELDVHQIELEMQNEELHLANIRAETEAEKYLNLYDFAPSGYLTLSKKDEILELNFSGATLLGKERSRLLNKRFAFFIADESKPTYLLFLKEIFESKTKQTCEIKLANNFENPIFIYLTGIVDENNNQCLITMLDISQHKKAEEEIKISEEKYRTLFETNRDSITILRIDSEGNIGNFIVTNPATTVIFGYTEQEILAMNIQDIEIASDEKRKERLATLLNKGKIAFETTLKNKNGNQVNVEIECILINYLNEPAVMNITRDISERKQNKENTRKAQENLATILEAIPDMLFEVGIDGRIYHYQTHHNDLLAAPPEAFMGKLLQDILPPDVSKICMEAIQEADKKNWSSGKQYALDLQQGKYWFELSASPIKGGNNLDKHFIILARDITARKEAEGQLVQHHSILSAILESASSAVFSLDSNYCYTCFNSTHAQEMKWIYGADIAIGHSLLDYQTVEEDREIARKNLDRALAGERFIDAGYSGDAGLKRHYYEIIHNPIIDASGKVTGVSIFAFEITDRIKAEEQLRFEKERIRTILELVGNPIFLKDNEHRFTYANSAFCTLFGLDEKDIIGKTLAENFSENELEHFFSMDQKVLDTGITNVTEEKLTIKDNLHTFITSKTRFIDAEGNKALIGSSYDITERKKAEEALQKSQEKLQGIFNVANSGIVLIDNSGNFLLFNDWCCKLLGYTRSELQELNSNIISHPDDLEESSALNKKIIEGKIETYQIEKRYLRKDKSFVWCELSASAIKDQDNNVVNIIGIVNDITEKRATKVALQESETRLIETQELAKVGSWETDFSFDNAIWSKETARIYGIDENATQFTLEQFLSIVHPEDRLLVQTEFVHSIKKNSLSKLEHRIITPAGIEKFVEQRWVIVRDNQDQPLRAVGSCHDITERKLAEELVLQSKSRFSSIINSSPVAMALNDEQLNITYLNPSFTARFGYTLEDIPTVGDWLLKAYPEPNYRAKITETWLATVEKVNQTGEELAPMEVIIRCKNGSDKTIMANGCPLLNSNKTEYINNFYDITERKQAELSLKNEKRRLAVILIGTGAGTWEWNIQTGATIFNEQWANIIGYTIEELTPVSIHTWEKYTHPDDLKHSEEILEKHFKGEQDYYECEARMKHKNGDWIWVLDRGRINEWDVDGKPLVMSGTHLDITEKKIAENTLYESEEKYRNLVENSPDGVVIYIEDKIAFINEEGVRMLGAKNKDEIIGKPILQFIHPNSVEDVVKRMKEIVTDNYVSKSVEEKFMRLDGTAFDVEIKGIPTLYKHKKGVQIIVHDITERKKSSLLLNKINRVYALISQINNLIILTHNQEELFQEICNIAVNFGKFRISWIGLLNENHKIITAAFAGHKEGYFKEKNLTTILDVPRGRGPTGIALREGRTIICNDIANDPMMKLWRKDALERGYSSVISIPIIVRNKIIGAFNLYSEERNFFSSEEEISLLEKIILNISFALEKIQVEEERKKTEEKIRQLSQAVEQSPVTIVITNTLGEIEYVNPKFVETTGYTLEEVMSKNTRFLKTGHTTQREYKGLWQTIVGGKEWHGEFYNKKKDGSFFWESASISPIKNAEGKITHFIALKEDITNRKNVEKELVKSKEHAEESDRLKLVFLANMSHEIRTPMNGILGFTELLKAPHISDEEQQEYIRIIEKSGKRMLNIINDIISISKIESGQIEVSDTETNINEQLEYIHTFFKPEAKLKGIDLTFLKLLPSENNYIKTDREKLYAILTNLVKNALKFTNEGSIEIGCEKKGGYLEFFVKDTGLGIPKSQEKIIFERFRQANESISRTHEGSGLGLAISKAYVEILDGRIWVESEEGKGSTFYFTIPFHSDTDHKNDPDVDTAISKIKEENKVKDLKVLIVEDDAISKLLITIAVKPYSKEILKVCTGIEAIEACRNNPDIDLVMMDINMPEMGGYEATKNIREFNKDLVIIAQTANGMQIDRDNAIAAGCTDYISKPINIIDLGALIQKYFGK